MGSGFTNARINRFLAEIEKAEKRIFICPNMTFGRLKTIKMCGWCYTRGYKWLCSCSCQEGKEIEVFSWDLKSGNVRSCGCWGKENRQRMKDFYTPAFCIICGAEYRTNKYKKSKKMCGKCSHRLSAREWARRNAKRKTFTKKC
jgi:hypothetical protein